MFNNPFKKEDELILEELVVLEEEAPVVEEVEQAPKEKRFPVQINSRGIETRRGENGARFVVGSVNGYDFKIECNTIVEVPEDVYNALLPLINKQKGNG